MIYNDLGLVRISIVDGNSHVGIYSEDGRINVVLNDGTTRTGITHPCGAINAIEVTDVPSSIQDPNGSVYIYNTDEGYVLYNPNHGVSPVAPAVDIVAILDSDVIAYWDAARGDLISSIDNVITGWTDIIGGYELTRADIPTSPTYNPTGLAGTPSISFSNAQYLTTTDANLMAALPDGAEPCEIWALCSQDALPADTTTRHVASYGGSSLVTGRSISRTVNTGVNRTRTYTGIGASATNVNDTTVDLSGIHVLRGVFGATDTSLSIDGGTNGSAAAVPATTNSRLRIGSLNASGPSNHWQGEIAAVLITHPLSGEKVTALHNYFG